MGIVRGFEVLTGSYLGEDWDLYGPTIDDAIRFFAREGRADDIAASIAGFEQLLANPMSDDEYYNRWNVALQSGYDPRDHGDTFPEWFAHALDVLRTEAATSRTRPSRGEPCPP